MTHDDVDHRRRRIRFFAELAFHSGTRIMQCVVIERIWRRATRSPPQHSKVVHLALYADGSHCLEPDSKLVPRRTGAPRIASEPLAPVLQTKRQCHIVEQFAFLWSYLN
jgi:hypothetical protein